jgi:nucleotidyltransferase/DNA polymerase involved in DNA repair
LKLRYGDFTTITRSHTDMATQNGDQIERRAVGLLDRTEAATRSVRLLGVSVHNFVEVARVSALPEGWLPFEDES